MVKNKKVVNGTKGSNNLRQPVQPIVPLLPPDQAVINAQKTIRKYIKEGTSLVDELIESRQEEAAFE